MNSFDLKVFGQNVQRLRKSKGWTQDKLAELLDISDKQVSHIECARAKNPGFDGMMQICMVFGVSFDEMFKKPDYLSELRGEIMALDKDKRDLINDLLDKVLEAQS